MATSINNSGVTFPDSTTQTTAASASPGVLVTSGSLVGSTSVTVTNCFSSTYSTYQVFLRNVQPTSSFDYPCIRIYANGATRTSTYYYFVNNGQNNTNNLALGYADTSITLSAQAFLMFSNSTGAQDTRVYAQFISPSAYSNFLGAAYYQNDAGGSVTGINFFMQNGGTFGGNGSYRIVGYV